MMKTFVLLYSKMSEKGFALQFVPEDWRLVWSLVIRRLVHHLMAVAAHQEH